MMVDGSSKNKISFAYFLAFSVMLHMLLIAVPLSLPVHKQKEKMEIYFLSGGGSGVQGGGQASQQQHAMGATARPLRSGKPAADVSSGINLAKASGSRDDKPGVSGDTPVRARISRKESAGDTPSAAGMKEQGVPPISQTGSQAGEEAAGYNRVQGEGITPGASVAAPGMGSSGSDGAGDTVFADFGSTDGPHFLQREVPEYPFVLRKRGEEGTAVLTLQIDEKGHLVTAEVMSATNAAFAEAALRAMKKSTFKPAQRNGKPVTSRAILPVRFRLDQ